MNYRSLLLHSEPRFGARMPGVSSADAPTLHGWLKEQASLTRRLRALCGDDFRVEVIGEAWRRPFPGEARLLGNPQRTLVWTREVALLAGSRPLVLARSLMPRSMLSGQYALLGDLGQRPLGEWLFTHPHLRRLGLEFARVAPEQWRSPLARSEGRGAGIWGRRALYQIPRHRLLVCEWFLPQLFRLEGEQHGLAD